MKRFIVLSLFVIAASGCFAVSGSVHSGGMTYEASGLNAPSPMEMAAADQMSANADFQRAAARTVEAHPELLRGYGYGGWGYGYGYPTVNPRYFYPNYPAPAQGSGTSEEQQPAEGQSRQQHEGSQP